MFFVAYTLDGQDAGKRPLTFAFNGGPGSASVWLHMGALGPKRVVLQPNGFMPPRALSSWKTIPTPCSTRATWCWWMRWARGSAGPPTPRINQEILGRQRRYRGLQRIHPPVPYRGTSAGPRRCSCSAKATEPRARRASRGISPTAGLSFNGITLLSTVLNFETLIDNKTNDEPYDIADSDLHHDRGLSPQAACPTWSRI